MLRRLLERLTRPPVLTGFAVLQAALALVLVARTAWQLDGVVDADCEVVIGDYLAFHTGAWLVAHGEGEALYDLTRQSALQDTLTGCTLERWQPYVNPPLLALVLAPLTGLGPRAAFHLFGLASTLALGFASFALVRALPVLAATPVARLTAALLAFGFAPIASTLAGGQNTALSFALLSACFASLHARRDVLAGTWLGLLSYKPTLLPLLLLVVVLQRRWRVLGAAALVAYAHYLLGGLVVGFDWPLRLLETGARYRVLEWSFNVATHVSLLPFFEHALPAFGAVPGAIASVVVGVLAIVAWRRLPPDLVLGPLGWAIAVTGALLVSPHLQYYDAGLVALPVLLGLERRAARGAALPPLGRLALIAGYLGYPVYALSSRLGFQPLTVALVLVFGWLLHEARASRDAGQTA